ncbi:hypothetical protein TNCV_4995191 [Trichonephila clavipes]|nr:hypothetical protein TNCV_4995191 [Trichonephila clavipes]
MLRNYKSGRGSRMDKVSGRAWPCHEFKPSTTKDPRYTRYPTDEVEGKSEIFISSVIFVWHYKATRKLLVMDLVNLNLSQIKMTTPEFTPSPNFHTMPTPGFHPGHQD